MDRPKHYHRSDYFCRTGMPLFVFAISGPAEHAFHSHDFTELAIVLSGSGRHITDREQYPIQAGDVFVIHQNIKHAYQYTRKMKLINVLFDIDQLKLPVEDVVELDGYQALFVVEPRLRSAGGLHHHCRLAADELTVVRELLTTIIREHDRKQPGYRWMASGLFMQVIGFLSRCYSRVSDPEPRTLLRLGKALSFIKSHYTEPLTLKQVAGHAAMSPSTLHRAFQRSFQTSPIDYLIGLRILLAQELLAGGELNVTEIASRCGFSDSNYFARQFRRRMDLSPREFRRQSAQDG